MCPDRGLTKEATSGRKVVKKRITYSMCGNADGSDILQPFVIGKSAKPRAFKGKTGAQLGFRYRNNVKAWMTSILFEEWLQEWNRTLKAQSRHILLWVDNFSGHTIPASCTNIQTEFFSPNLTSHVQPMDAGIIRCFKAHYRKLFVARSIDRFDAGVHPSKIYEINQLEAMRLADIAWLHVKPEVHRNCWRKAGILPPQDSVRENTPPPNPVMNIDHLLNPAQSAEQELETEINQLVDRGCLQKRDRMSLEEILDPEGEHGSGVQTRTDEEIVEALQKVSVDSEVTDVEDQEAEIRVVGRSEALEAANTLRCFISDRTDEWARTLENTLATMTLETRHEAIQTMKSTVITSYFSPKTQ